MIIRRCGAVEPVTKRATAAAGILEVPARVLCDGRGRGRGRIMRKRKRTLSTRKWDLALLLAAMDGTSTTCGHTYIYIRYDEETHRQPETTDGAVR